MKAKELIKMLQQLDPNIVVIIDSFSDRAPINPNNCEHVKGIMQNGGWIREPWQKPSIDSGEKIEEFFYLGWKLN